MSKRIAGRRELAYIRLMRLLLLLFLFLFLLQGLYRGGEPPLGSTCVFISVENTRWKRIVCTVRVRQGKVCLHAQVTRHSGDPL